MFGTKSKARKEEDQQNSLKAIADQGRVAAATAVDTASKPDPITQRITDKATALDDWESGKSGPIDVRNMPGGGAQIALYDAARQSTDAGRVGTGVNSMGDGVNANFAASLDKENTMDRDLAAKGMLENNVNATLAGKDAVLGNLSGMAENRNMNIANLQENAAQNDQSNFLKYLMRPRTPSFLKQLILAGVNQSGEYAKAAAMP